MAKAKTTSLEGDKLSVLDDIINKEFSEFVDISKEDNDVKYHLDIGNYALNYACSKNLRKGVPCGRVTSLFGLSATGKSLIMAGLAKDPQVDMVLVLSAEGGGISKSIFDFVNAPINKVRYTPVTTFTSYRVDKESGKIEEVSDKEIPAKLETEKYIYHKGLIYILKKFINQLEYNKIDSRVLILLDSMANIKSVREMGGVQDMGMKGKNLNDLFSTIDNSIEKTNVAFVFSNKVYTNMGNIYNPWVQSGGQSVIYNPSLSISLTAMQDNEDLTEAQIKEEKLRRKTALGNSMKTVRATIAKSRCGTENRNATFLIDATYGIMKHSGLFEMLKDFGLIVKEGTRYKIPGVIEDSFYKKDFLSLFKEKEDEYIDMLQPLLEKKEQEIKDKRLGLEVSDMGEYVDEISNEEDEDDMVSLVKKMEADIEE